MKNIYELLNDVDMNVEEYENQKLSADETKKIKKQISKEMKGMKKTNYWKPIIATAACLTLAIGGGKFYHDAQPETTTKVVKNQGNGNKENPQVKKVPNNRFILQMKSQEVDNTNGVQISDYGENEGGGISSYGDEAVSYITEFPIHCEGENIKQITYSIEGAAFAISTNESDNVFLDYELTQDAPAYPWVTMDGSTFNDCVKNYTVSYDKQTSDSTYIGIIYGTEYLPKEQEQAILSNVKYVTGNNIEKKKEIYDNFYKNIVITCTVTYNDETTETKEICVSAKAGKVRDLHDDRFMKEDMDIDIILNIYKTK